MTPGCAIRGRTSCSTRPGTRAAAVFTFNAWGAKCRPFDKDAAIGGRVAALASARPFRSDLVVEGGGFLSDGEGTLITAESCVLNPNRNPGWSKAEADAELRAMLGVQKIIWLPGDLTDGATDGHVDGYVAFARPAVVLCETVADPADPRFSIMAENRRVLESETDARGRRFDLLPIVEAPRTAVPAGEELYLPFVCEFLSRERRRHCACLRDRRGCRGRRYAAARISGAAGGVCSSCGTCFAAAAAFTASPSKSRAPQDSVLLERSKNSSNSPRPGSMIAQLRSGGRAP